MDISTKLSGESVHTKGKLSKRGNPYFRKILFQVAWGLIMHNKAFKKLYEYHRGRGKHYFTCLSIIGRKLLNVIYGMHKSGKSFNPEMVTVPA
jgi:transposase